MSAQKLCVVCVPCVVCGAIPNATSCDLSDCSTATRTCCLSSSVPCNNRKQNMDTHTHRHMNRACATLDSDPYAHPPSETPRHRFPHTLRSNSSETSFFNLSNVPDFFRYSRTFCGSNAFPLIVTKQYARWCAN